MTKEKYNSLNVFQKIDYFFFGGMGTLGDRVWYYGGILLMVLIYVFTVGTVGIWNLFFMP